MSLPNTIVANTILPNTIVANTIVPNTIVANTVTHTHRHKYKLKIESRAQIQISMQYDPFEQRDVGQAQQMHLVVKDLGKQGKEKKLRGGLSLFVHSPICHLIDVDALEPEHFPPMDLMDSDALAGNGSNAIWRDWRGPLTDHKVAPLFLDPFLFTSIHPHHAGENFPCKKTIQVDKLTFPGYRIQICKKKLSLSLEIYWNAVATFFLHLLHAKRRWAARLQP